MQPLAGPPDPDRGHGREGAANARYFARSNRGPGGDLAVFVRESSGIRVVELRHEERPPWWHGVALVIAEAEGAGGPLRFAAAHLAPSSPSLRQIEAEAFGVLCEQPGPLIAGGDWNAVPVGDVPPDIDGIRPGKARRKQDDRAALALAEYMTDAGAHVRNTIPTVGHTRNGKLAYRCDRVYTTLPPESITSFEVMRDLDPDSDHRPVVA
jgi:endonuclease/exonuclease/phosphatase family metal-dependent hydrolase